MIPKVGAMQCSKQLLVHDTCIFFQVMYCSDLKDIKFRCIACFKAHLWVEVGSSTHLETKPIKIGLGDTFCCTSCEVSYQVSHVQAVRDCSLNPLLDKNDKNKKTTISRHQGLKSKK